jgi:predicted negative regulator of RcsB-dependent stress response
MADFDLKTDEEKAEELKQWWKDNGTSVVVGIALAIGGMFGWQQWQTHKKTQAEGGSRLFAQLSDKKTDHGKILKQIQSDYGSTPYSALAALTAAKDSCSQDNIDKNTCIGQLQQASKSDQPEIADVARLRLARSYIAAKQLNDAEGIINAKFPAAYASLVNEIKGDIYVAKNEINKAREAYDRAILSSKGQSLEFLKMKRDDLGQSTDSASNKPPADKQSGA